MIFLPARSFLLYPFQTFRLSGSRNQIIVSALIGFLGRFIECYLGLYHFHQCSIQIRPVLLDRSTTRIIIDSIKLSSRYTQFHWALRVFFFLELSRMSLTRINRRTEPARHDRIFPFFLLLLLLLRGILLFPFGRQHLDSTGKNIWKNEFFFLVFRRFFPWIRLEGTEFVSDRE